MSTLYRPHDAYEAIEFEYILRRPHVLERWKLQEVYVPWVVRVIGAFSVDPLPPEGIVPR